MKILRAASLTFSLILFFGPAFSQNVTTDTLTYGKFGKVWIYKPDKEPQQVVLFISGDAGWKLGVVDMAHRLTEQGALVLGIDILHYNRMLRKENKSCYYISGDFELLSEYVQKKLHFTHYITPVLAGYSSGATMVYALIAQAPDHTYKGALALGFDPGITINKPLCKGSGLRSDSVPHGYSLLPRENMSAVFVVLNGDLDKDWTFDKCREFLSKIKNSKFYALQHVGHGFSVPKNWAPEFIEGYHYIISNYIPPVPQNIVSSLKELPIVEVPAKNNDSPDLPMMIVYSGDGGWRGFISNMAENYATHGIPVVGVDVLKYFWNESPPDKSARDLANIIDYYSQLWNRNKIILTGYSFGANVLPFIYNDLPDDVREHVVLINLMSPSDYAEFIFHFSDWLNEDSSQKFKLAPEIKKITGPGILITFGEDEKEDLSGELTDHRYQFVRVKGDHHYDYNIKSVTDPVLLELRQKKEVN